MIIDTKDYLAHHGIAGQKWGVRRYQNEDGSLTPEGYEHYGYKQNGKVTRESAQKYWDAATKQFHAKYEAIGSQAAPGKDGLNAFREQDKYDTKTKFSETQHKIEKAKNVEERTKIISDYMNSECGKEIMKGHDVIQGSIKSKNIASRAIKVGGAITAGTTTVIAGKMIQAATGKNEVKNAILAGLIGGGVNFATTATTQYAVNKSIDNKLDKAIYTSMKGK